MLASELIRWELLSPLPALQCGSSSFRLLVFLTLSDESLDEFVAWIIFFFFVRSFPLLLRDFEDLDVLFVSKDCGVDVVIVEISEQLSDVVARPLHEI